MSYEMAISLFGLLVTILGAGWKLSRMFSDLQEKMADNKHALDIRLVKIETKLSLVSDSLQPLARGRSGEHLMRFDVPKQRTPSYESLGEPEDGTTHVRQGPKK